MLALISPDHIEDTAYAIEVELAAPEGWEVPVNVVPKSLISHFKTQIYVSFAPKRLINLNIFAIRVIH
jgi:hypothetical protein